jgi:hypothetical protein
MKVNEATQSGRKFIEGLLNCTWELGYIFNFYNL